MHELSRRPRPDVHVDLQAPSVDHWTWGDPSAPSRVNGNARDFCLVVVQRRHLDDTDLLCQGPHAREWLLIAKAFAGRAGTGRRPGQFPRQGLAPPELGQDLGRVLAEAGHWALKLWCVVFEAEAGANDGGGAVEVGHGNVGQRAALVHVGFGQQLAQPAHDAGGQASLHEFALPLGGESR